MTTFRTPAGERPDIHIETVVIAGWAGRDRDAVDAHIRELEALGVAPPSTVPCFYRVGPEMVTTEETAHVLGSDGSGEIEVVLLTDVAGRHWVSVGSDHTDRKVEAYSVAVSKQMCPKPISAAVWSYDDVADHWDRLRLTAHATIDGTRVLYQDGAVDGLLPPSELIARWRPGATRLPPNTAMFCGTLAAIGGVRPSTRFEMTLHDPVHDRSLYHEYTIRTVPVVA